MLTEIDVKNLNKLQVLCGVDGIYSKILLTGFIQTVSDVLSKKQTPKLITAYLPGGYELTYKDDGLPDSEFSFLKERDGVDNIKLNIPYSRK